MGFICNIMGERFNFVNLNYLFLESWFLTVS